MTLTIDADGTPRSGSLSRWSNPDTSRFRYLPFGAVVQKSGVFAGFTIPTELRVAYFIGTSRFESEGELFRATIEDA